MGNRITSECNSWGVSSPWIHISLTPQHPEFSHLLYLCPMHRRNGKSKAFGQSLSILPGSLWCCIRGDSQQEFALFQGQNLGNKEGTAALGTNFKSSLCRKSPSAYNKPFALVLVQSHINSQVWSDFQHLFSLFMPSWKSHPFPGTLKLLPPRWISPLAAGTAFLPKLLIRSNQNKSQPDRFQGLKLLNWCVCKIIPPIIED